MKKLLVPFLTVLLMLGINSFGIGQSKELAKLLDNPDKLRKAVLVQSTAIRKIQLKKGWAKAEDYVLPQRVGLLTYVVNDKAQTSISVSGSVETITRTKRSSKTLSAYANHLYIKTISGIKESFSSRGMNLLEIDEYLDNEQKTALYDGYELKKLKAAKAFDGLTGSGNSGPVQGYRNMTLPYLGSLPKAIKERDEFFEALGLDGILVVTIEMNTYTDSFWLI